MILIIGIFSGICFFVALALWIKCWKASNTYDQSVQARKLLKDLRSADSMF